MKHLLRTTTLAAALVLATAVLSHSPAAAEDIYVVMYDPNGYGTWDMDDTIGTAVMGDPTPAFSGDLGTNHDPGYIFAGWTPELSDIVTQDIVYAAQWEPLTVTILVPDAEKLYDGAPLMASGGRAAWLPPNYGLSITGYTSVTDAGTGVGDAFYKLFFTGMDVTGLVNVRVETGVLTVKPREIELSSGSAARPYNSEPLTNHNVFVSGDGFAPGEGADYTVTGSQTEPGSSANDFTYTLWPGTNGNNYNIRTSAGTLAVTEEPHDASYTVTYRPGAHGSFSDTSHPGLAPGAATPAPPYVSGSGGDWGFAGWYPLRSETVTRSVEYVAQWVWDPDRSDDRDSAGGDLVVGFSGGESDELEESAEPDGDAELNPSTGALPPESPAPLTGW